MTKDGSVNYFINWKELGKHLVEMDYGLFINNSEPD